MLWVNLLMDSLASLSLATERPSSELLKRRPYKFSQPLVSGKVLWHIVSHSLYELTVLLVLLFAGQFTSLSFNALMLNTKGEFFYKYN